MPFFIRNYKKTGINKLKLAKDNEIIGLVLCFGRLMS